MRICAKSEQYSIQRYSLTGDLLAYYKCPLQYRYYNKGSLPPSVPVQLWFGEFIHGVMEEGFLRWKEGTFDINRITFDSVQEISVSVADRLAARGLKPYGNIFLREDRGGKKCKDMEANKRAFESVRIWAPHLYPLIQGNEVPLEDIRPMPDTPLGKRSDLYAISGVADVITSIKIKDISPRNRVVQYLMENDRFKDFIDEYDEFEIVVDYKGTQRPNLDDPAWHHHEWQLQTYMWLRRRQLMAEGSDIPVIGGFLLYLNELSPSKKFNSTFLDVVQVGNTDILPKGDDLELVKVGKPGTERFCIRRSFRLIPYDETSVGKALEKFDSAVQLIETSVQEEMRDSRNVMGHWKGVYREESCTACDMKTFCPYTAYRFKPTVP